MNTKLKLFLYILCILTGHVVNAQTKISPLKIGDKIPELVLSKLVNRAGPVNLSSLHQQDLLIINFWATWCGSCIKEMPTLDSLATAYPEKVKILAVAYEPGQTVNAFLKKHPEIPVSHLWITTEDKVLVAWFKHQVLPHNIWIDKDGVVKNVTGSDEVNANNVLQFFDKELQTDVKKDVIDFDFMKTFHLKDSDFMYRSLITGFTAGIIGGITTGGTLKGNESWYTRFFAFNVSRQQLLWSILDKPNKAKDYYNVMHVVTSDSTRFFWPEQCPQSFKNSKYKSREDWKKENLYCYELTLPTPVKDSAFFDLLHNDIHRVFQLDVSVKNERMPTCILTRNNGPAFEMPVNDSAYIDLNTKKLKAHNVTVLNVFNFLNENVKPNLNAKPIDPPFIDQTGINHPIDLEVDFTKESPGYAEIKDMIRLKYGINWEVKEHDYPVTIIKDLVP